MKQEQTRTVDILLTKYTDLFSRLISLISKNGYSHASISIDEKMETFYSFSYKGFVIEQPRTKKTRKRTKESICIRMEVSEKTYSAIKDEIDYFRINQSKFSYSKMGIVLCMLHIPYKFKNKYFCSQFVAEVLSQADTIILKKKESLYLPNHFLDEMECVFPNKQLLYNMV